MATRSPALLDAERTAGPRPAGDARRALIAREVGSHVDLPSRTVLLVDDDADMRLYLRSCLRVGAAPFDRVMEAADGLEALRLVRSEAVDVVISDVGLPGLDGRRLSRAIRDDAALRHVSVLLIGGDGVLGESAADGFLLEPFNSSQLLAALDGLAPRYRDTPDV